VPLTGINLPFYFWRGVEKLTAIDESRSMLEQAQAKAGMIAGADNRVQFIHGDVHHMPFPDNTFDAIVDTFSLCVYSDPVQALREMARVVKPGASVRAALPVPLDAQRHPMGLML
jgi:methyltransferase OMS1, mitochondrial